MLSTGWTLNVMPGVKLWQTQGPKPLWGPKSNVLRAPLLEAWPFAFNAHHSLYFKVFHSASNAFVESRRRPKGSRRRRFTSSILIKLMRDRLAVLMYVCNQEGFTCLMELISSNIVFSLPIYFRNKLKFLQWSTLEIRFQLYFWSRNNLKSTNQYYWYVKRFTFYGKYGSLLCFWFIFRWKYILLII